MQSGIDEMRKTIREKEPPRPSTRLTQLRHGVPAATGPKPFHRPAPGEVDLRGWEWRYLWQFCRSEATAILKEPNDNSIISLAVSGDGQWLAAGGLFAGELFVLNLATKEKIKVPTGAGNVRVAFSPLAPLLAIGIDDRERGFSVIAANFPASRVLLWDATTRKIVREISLAGTCDAVAFSSDGQTLATVNLGRKNTISLWRCRRTARCWPRRRSAWRWTRRFNCGRSEPDAKGEPTDG